LNAAISTAETPASHAERERGADQPDEAGNPIPDQTQP
jgi:hypothetical protein